MARMTEKPEQGTQEMVRWLAQEALDRAKRNADPAGTRYQIGPGFGPDYKDWQRRQREAAAKRQQKKAKRQQEFAERRADQERRSQEASQRWQERKARAAQQGPIWDRGRTPAAGGSNLAGLAGAAGGGAISDQPGGGRTTHPNAYSGGAAGPPGQAGAAGPSGLQGPPGGLGDLGTPEPGDQRYQAHGDYPDPMDYSAQIRQNRLEREAGRDPRDKVRDKGPIAPVAVDRFAGIGGDEFGGMPDMGIAGGPPIDPGIMAQQYPSGESGYNFPTPVIPNQRPIGPLPPNWKPTPGGEYKFPDPLAEARAQEEAEKRRAVEDEMTELTRGEGGSREAALMSDDEWSSRRQRPSGMPPTTPPVLPDPGMQFDVGPIPSGGGLPGGLEEELMGITTGTGSRGALLLPQMIGEPQQLAPWSGPDDPFAGRPRPPRPPRPTSTGPPQPQPRERGPGSPYPSGSNPATRRRARERGGNPNDMRTGQGIPISSAMPAPANNLRNLSRAGNWRGMV